jgi:hypothetical protein
METTKSEVKRYVVCESGTGEAICERRYIVEVPDDMDLQMLDGERLSVRGDSKIRKCGDCKLCCKVFTIPELNKLAGEWCPHCPGKGCSTYQSRPNTCREYRCVWLERPESLPDELRPDKTSVVMNEFAEPGLPMIELHESHRGAARKLLPVLEPVRDHGFGLVGYTGKDKPVGLEVQNN